MKDPKDRKKKNERIKQEQRTQFGHSCTLTSDCKELKGLLKRIGKEKVNRKGKKVILSIIKNLSRFVIPYLEGISRFRKGKMIKDG